mmetsp:Transcript_21792/g.70505  ORF Transcript_21792/g.70505 Transcript_21792/m.70505 type:complete len:827 (-) Transcript_21792:116-2596(-)
MAVMTSTAPMSAIANALPTRHQALVPPLRKTGLLTPPRASQAPPLAGIARSKLQSSRGWSSSVCPFWIGHPASGLTVCVMVIPQSMSYANVAGLPYVYGMYSACVPTLVYALFGESRQLAVGPVAMVSLILRAGLIGKLSFEDCPQAYNGDEPKVGGADQNVLCTDAYISLACAVAFMIGVINLLACVFKLSFLVSFLGHPVISGFSTGSAIIIGCSQLKYFLGVKLPSTDNIVELICALAEQIRDVKPAPLILGTIFLSFLAITKRISKKNRRFRMLGPIGPLLTCMAGTLLVWAWPALREDYGVAHVGHVPGGGIPISLGSLKREVTWEHFQAIQVTTFSVALIGYMESIAISKNLASQHGYPINAGQELLALGAANIVGSCFSCYPVTGSFSRSAVANTTGAQTQLAGVITALGMLLVLLFLTPLFYYLPMFALAAIVINSVTSLIAYDVAAELWRVKKWDFVLWFVAFLGTLFIGPLQGIGIAVLLSLVVIIYEAVRPQLTILWRVPGTSIFRSIDQETEGQFIPNVFIVRLGASMYFANASHVKDALLRYLDDLAEVDTTEYLVLELAGVLNIDATAAGVLQEIVEDFRSRGIRTAFAMVTRRAMRTMHKSNLVSFLGESWFFPTVNDAVRGCLTHQAAARQGLAVMDMDINTDAPNPHFNFISTEPEVGVSNDLFHQFTTVSIGLPRPIADLMPLLMEAFAAGDCRVVGAQADNVQHTYHLVGRGGQKLMRKDLEPLRVRLLELVGQICRGDHRPDSGDELDFGSQPEHPAAGAAAQDTAQSVAEALAAERLKIAQATQRAQDLEVKLRLLGGTLETAAA